jgi:phospholipid/cholesterol/gamma-HCH transport system substrate-binding protein
MANNTNEVRVGITLTIAGIILVAGILWLGGFTFGEHRYSFTIVFDQVEGLVAGDEVTVAGVEGGEVESLRLAPFGKVLVVVAIDGYIKIPEDSQFSVASYGLIGSRVISVKPGRSDVYIEPGQIIQGTYEKGLGDVVAEMGNALVEIRGVLASADELLTDQEGKDLFKNVLASANDAAADLRDAAVVLKSISNDLDTFLTEQRQPAAAAIEAAGDAATGFTEVTGELKRVSSSLDSIVVRVESGRGTLGKLVNDDAAYQEFLGAVTDLRELVDEIKANPKSFVKFSLF